MFDLQVLDSKADYTNCEVNLPSQIYIAGDARTAAGTEVQMGCIGAQNEQLEDL